jgi:alkyl hydroperoxide reductase subunit AhpC
MNIYDDDQWEAKYHEKVSKDRIGSVVPAVNFKVRVRDDSVAGSNPYRWSDVNSYDLFGNKRVIVFSLPGAFTPTCDTYQLPGFEEKFADFVDLGISEIYCVSVNDSFVMNCWAKQQKLEYVRVIPDGNAAFTNKMHMLVQKENLGFGDRSWRYAMIVNNGVIEAWFEEPGFRNNAEDDPYGETSPENILTYLRVKAVEKERGK